MHTTTDISTSRLRLVLRANAATSAVTGAIALVAGGWVSRELGIDHVVLTRLLGAGLLGFAVIVAAISRATRPRLLTESLLVSMADAGWVLGTVVVLATGVLTPAGNVVALVVGLAVADFGATQLWFRARATDPVGPAVAV